MTAAPRPAPAAQLVLAQPGYCTKCGVIRLSRADIGPLCMFCQEEQAKADDRRSHAGSHRYKRTTCIVCGAPAVYRSKCRPCNREDTRNYRARRRECQPGERARLGGGRAE